MLEENKKADILDRQDCENSLNFWSGWADLNRRPPEPHSGALPGCATSRVSIDMLSQIQR